jgi:DNA-binding sugar fermentation-stimulating protein
MIQITFGRLKNGSIQTCYRFKRRLTLTIALGKLRADARSFNPFSERDAAFAQILQHAKDVGVKFEL